MGLGIGDLLGEQNQRLEEIGWKRGELQSSSPSSTETPAHDALAQGSGSGHVLVPAQGFTARLCSGLCLCHATGWGWEGAEGLWPLPWG